jgi:hypothetical protein
MQWGPIRHTPADGDHVGSAPRRVLIERRTAFDPAVLPTDASAQEVLGAIAADMSRTQSVVDDVAALVAEGRFPLVHHRVARHLEALADRLFLVVPALVRLHSGIGRRASHSGEPCQRPQRVVLAKGRYIGEAFDDHGWTGSCSPCPSPDTGSSHRTQGASTVTTTLSTRSASSTTSTTRRRAEKHVRHGLQRFRGSKLETTRTSSHSPQRRMGAKAVAPASGPRCGGLLDQNLTYTPQA